MRAETQTNVADSQLSFEFSTRMADDRPGERVCEVTHNTPGYLVDDIANQLATLLPKEDGIYSLADAAGDCGLGDLWPTASQVDQEKAVRAIVGAAYNRGAHVFVGVVSAIIRFGSRRLRRAGREIPQ